MICFAHSEEAEQHSVTCSVEMLILGEGENIGGPACDKISSRKRSSLPQVSLITRTAVMMIDPAAQFSRLLVSAATHGLRLVLCDGPLCKAWVSHSSSPAPPQLPSKRGSLPGPPHSMPHLVPCNHCLPVRRPSVSISSTPYSSRRCESREKYSIRAHGGPNWRCFVRQECAQPLDRSPT